MDVGDDLTINTELSDTLYLQLKKIAKSQRRNWSGNQTLNTTSLINEAWLKMKASDIQFNDKTHFFATASRVMRQVLINYAQHSACQKRCAPETYQVDESSISVPFDIDKLLFINQIIEKLESKKPRACQILECRIFGGMNNKEIAAALDISVATVKREWQLASTWMYHQLKESETNCHEPVRRA